MPTWLSGSSQDALKCVTRKCSRRVSNWSSPRGFYSFLFSSLGYELQVNLTPIFCNGENIFVYLVIFLDEIFQDPSQWHGGGEPIVSKTEAMAWPKSKKPRCQLNKPLLLFFFLLHMTSLEIYRQILLNLSGFAFFFFLSFLFFSQQHHLNIGT